MCYLSIKEQFTGRKVIPIGICTSLSCMKARRQLLWHSVKHFMDNAIFYVAFSWAFLFLFLANDWDRTGKGSLSKNGWFPQRLTKNTVSIVFFCKTWRCNLQAYAVTFFFSLWSTTRRKTVSRRSWKEGKRSFFYRALKVKSVPHVCCIYCSGNRLKLSAICI